MPVVTELAVVFAVVFAVGELVEDDVLRKVFAEKTMEEEREDSFR